MQHPTFERAAILQAAQQMIRLTRAYLGLEPGTSGSRAALAIASVAAGVSALREFQKTGCPENVPA